MTSFRRGTLPSRARDASPRLVESTALLPQIQLFTKNYNDLLQLESLVPLFLYNLVTSAKHVCVVYRTYTRARGAPSWTLVNFFSRRPFSALPRNARRRFLSTRFYHFINIVERNHYRARYRSRARVRALKKYGSLVAQGRESRNLNFVQFHLTSTN